MIHSFPSQVFEDAFEDAVEEQHVEPKEQTNINSSGAKKSKNPLSKRLSSMRDKRKHRQKQRELQRKEDEKAAGNENPAAAECAPIPMAEAIEEAKLSVDLFLSNKFEDAKNVVEPL